ncbi:hypothetical protein [Burkholderia latens]|uniref:Uncharacterized protein n=1 Tax=Burkholderia latens TaxID=488446 RepID=A0A6H9SM67_9BURK|nr:hypothetical protein [Burkholderia latens]KAB0635977.1 hypothetical protein F7R21_23475 [Burkholderia latens]
MKMSIFAALIMVIASIGWAAPPSESVVKSCLLAQSAASSVAIQNIDVDEVLQQDDYADGFNARYLFKYKDIDIGYADGKSDQALIYSGNIYPFSRSISVGNNGEIKPASFNPTLAQWSIAKDGRQRYVCVSFNFDGLGQSGSFQSVHGGYLLNSKTKKLYFAVRDVK